MDLQELVDCASKVDISDPSCMDKLLIYLETLQEEDEEFMQLLTDNCMNEEISWNQPWYQKGRSVTRPLKEQFEDESDTYRKDTLSKEENEIIEKNWRKFRKKFNMPDKLVCFARWKNVNKSRTTKSPVERARLYLIAFLARGLKRTLFQVYRHILTFYGCPNKRTYQPFELKLMEICFEYYPTKAVTWLSKILGREPRGLYKQLQVKYNGKIEKKKLKWTLPLATKFVQLLLKYTELPLKKLKNTKIDKHVWQKMENEMDQHYVYLKQFWYDKLHVLLFVKSDVKFNRLKKRIFKILRDSKYQVWTDIRWKDVLSHFPDGFTHRFLYNITHSLCRNFKNYLTAPLQDVVNYGLKRSKLIRYHNRRLKTLKLNKDGNLEYVNYSKSEI